MSSQMKQYCLKWKNFQSNMSDAFHKMLLNDNLVDVTLACDGESIRAHKIVLSACSPYFQHLFLSNPCKHPIVILKDVHIYDLRAIIDFMYRGEVNVPHERIDTLLKTAETLNVKGLTEVSESQTQRENEIIPKIVSRTKRRKRNKQKCTSTLKHIDVSDDEISEEENKFKYADDLNNGRMTHHVQSNNVLNSSKSIELRKRFASASRSNSCDFEPIKLLEQSMSTQTDDDNSETENSLSRGEIMRNADAPDQEDDDLKPIQILDDFTMNTEGNDNSLPTASRMSNQEANHTFQDPLYVDWSQRKCPYCNKEFTKAFSTKRHILSHLPFQKRFACDKCDKTYTRKDVLFKHQEKRHST